MLPILYSHLLILLRAYVFVHSLVPWVSKSTRKKFERRVGGERSDRETGRRREGEKIAARILGSWEIKVRWFDLIPLFWMNFGLAVRPRSLGGIWRNL